MVFVVNWQYLLISDTEFEQSDNLSFSLCAESFSFFFFYLSFMIFSSVIGNLNLLKCLFSICVCFRFTNSLYGSFVFLFSEFMNSIGTRFITTQVEKSWTNAVSTSKYIKSSNKQRIKCNRRSDGKSSCRKIILIVTYLIWKTLTYYYFNLYWYKRIQFYILIQSVRTFLTIRQRNEIASKYIT